ncbi:MAG: SDR family oxidoreductase [Variibacter sp.]|nr:SDR family oxidoreductase [Variibacter sp.]
MADHSSQPRRAFITGGSVGLGQAIAVALARDGYDLALGGRDAGRMKETLAKPEVAARQAVALTVDVRSQESIEAAFQKAVDTLGGIDVLVNNAGRQLSKPALEVGWEEWDDAMATNVKGAFFLSVRFARHCFDAGKPGAIVNIASTHGIKGLADRSVYGISKAAMAHMSRMLAIEWADKGIRVNAVAPGTVETPSRAVSLRDPERRAQMLSRIPIGRFPKAEEIAAAVRYLVSPEAAAVTGQVLAVDGGITA